MSRWPWGKVQRRDKLHPDVPRGAEPAPPASTINEDEGVWLVCRQEGTTQPHGWSLPMFHWGWRSWDWWHMRPICTPSVTWPRWGERLTSTSGPAALPGHRARKAAPARQGHRCLQIPPRLSQAFQLDSGPHCLPLLAGTGHTVLHTPPPMAVLGLYTLGAGHWGHTGLLATCSAAWGIPTGIGLSQRDWQWRGRRCARDSSLPSQSAGMGSPVLVVSPR